MPFAQNIALDRSLANDSWIGDAFLYTTIGILNVFCLLLLYAVFLGKKPLIVWKRD